MELKYLYTVKKIIETGNYQKAAQALNYAQSTITFQIKQLEKELAIKLFEKEKQQMVLTPEGQEVLPLINQVIEASEALINFQTQDSGLKGSLTLAVPETLLTYKLQPIFKAFKAQAPHVKLSIRVMNCYAIFDEMVNGQIDAAFHYDVRNYPNRIQTHPIGTFPLVLVASPELAVDQRDFVTAHQTKSVCHIQNDRDAFYLKIFNKYLHNQDIHLETPSELWSIETIKQSVMSNLGVAYLPRFTVEAELLQGKLIELETAIQDNHMHASFGYHQNKADTPTIRLLNDLIKQQLK
ncbi:LysR family transcriptional regulator [Fundicoccus culcitae]|uniref:LysR family transcriptional regulator n=1 Tax=Fundicoccus culcitae TaxID=2969821 RepID=A0ABY5P214_9LACT|nr:LysR family transcriptional regulator [Fundicoccus culcitae]UUX32742.1 LysR family transcriptional regulator [Fundicoccus culcitae]